MTPRAPFWVTCGPAAGAVGAVGGRVYRAGSTAAARRKVLDILERRRARRVVRGNTERLRTLDLDGEPVNPVDYLPPTPR